MERKKLHPVENIVFIKILAIIYNVTDWEEITDFGKARKDFLSKYLNLTNGTPSHDTFNRFFSLFSPDKFQQIFIGGLHELFEIDLELGNQIAIYDKSSRGTGSRKNKILQLLNAYIPDNKCILEQLKTKAKSNEITTIPKLLDAVELNDAVVGIDAIGCQRDIANKILERNGDYFLTVKHNQKTLYEDIESAFLVLSQPSPVTSKLKILMALG